MTDQSETVTTGWKCENCGRSGRLALNRHAGVFEGFNAVEDAHREVTPDCEAGMSLIRVWIEEATNAA